MTPILNRDFQHPSDGWYMIEPRGEHPNPQAGLVQVIDDQAAQRITDAFNRQAGPNFPGMLVDHEHFSHDADKETRAFGWLTSLANRADGIYGQIRWTKTGKDAVDGGDYRFFSTEYKPSDCEILNKEEETPRRIRPLALAGLTLTNKPNNKGGKPITNREEGTILNGDAIGHPFRGNQYTDTNQLQPGDVIKGDAYANIRQKAMTPYGAQKRMPLGTGVHYHIIEDKGTHFRARNLSTGAETHIHKLASNQKPADVHIVAHIPISETAGAASAQQTTTTKNRMQQIATKLGLAAEASEDAILAQVSEILNRASTATAAQAQIANRVSSLEAENKRLREDQVATDLETYKGRFTPEQEPVIRNLLLTNREQGIAFLKAQPAPKLAPAPVHNREQARSPKLNLDAEGEEQNLGQVIMNRARDFMVAQPGISLSKAIETVSKRDPALYRTYRDQFGPLKDN